MKIRAASRQSPLALLQVGEALDALRPHLPNDLEIERISSETIGDRDLTTPLTDLSIPDDFFTRELDAILLSGDADMVVHSAKDLPREIPAGITVACLLPAADIRDVLVMREGEDGTTEPQLIGTSSARREAYIRERWPQANVQPIRGSIQQRLAQIDAEPGPDGENAYDALITAACALDRLQLAHRITSYLPYDPTPDQGRLAVTVRTPKKDSPTEAADRELLTALQAADIRRRAGLVVMLGCPADLTLLPQRAHNYLAAADLVLHDRLVPEALIVELGERAVSVGKTGGQPSIPQSEIHRRMLNEAESGKLVVRLHGGEPGILGHLGETLEFLSGWRIRCDVIPAVSAAQTAAAHARTALTHRHAGRSITFRSGHAAGYDSDAMPGPQQGHQAIYMGVGQRERITNELLAAGWPAETSTIVGERIGYEDEAIHYLNLSKLAGTELETPAVILVGPVGFPHLGYTLFTGTDPEIFLRYGPLLHFPLIRLVRTPIAERQAALGSAMEAGLEGIIFPSRFAVACVIEALFAAGDVRQLAGKHLLAVGPATAAALAQQGLRADAAPDNFGGAAALAAELGPEFQGRYLYPCSNAAPTEKRVAAMASAGIELLPQVFYTNESVTHDRLPRLPFPRVLFTSGSTVRAYFKQFPEERTAARRWIAVGTSTLKVLDELGVAGEILVK